MAFFQRRHPASSRRGASRQFRADLGGVFTLEAGASQFVFARHAFALAAGDGAGAVGGRAWWHSSRW